MKPPGEYMQIIAVTVNDCCDAINEKGVPLTRDEPFRIYPESIKDIGRKGIVNNEITIKQAGTYVGTIAEYLRRIASTVDDTHAAINEKGVSLANDEPFRVYPDKIRAIQNKGIDIYDITLKQNYGEPTDAYIVAIDNGGLRIYRSKYQTEDFMLQQEIDVNAIKAAIEFNGVFVESGHLYVLDTQITPWVFWVDTENKLYGEHEGSRIHLADGVIDLTACRGWNSQEYPDRDMGLIVAYIKTNGTIAYRALVGIVGGTAHWLPEVNLSSAGDGNTYVQVLRLNDYRMGFAVTGINKLFVTKRELMGQALKSEVMSLQASQSSSIAWWDADTSVLDVEILITGENSIKVVGNYPLALWTTKNTHAQNITVTQDTARTISKMEIDDGILCITLVANISDREELTIQAPTGTDLQYVVRDDVNGKPFWPNTIFKYIPPVIPSIIVETKETMRLYISTDIEIANEEVSEYLIGHTETMRISIQPVIEMSNKEVTYVAKETVETMHLSVSVDVVIENIQVGESPV